MRSPGIYFLINIENGKLYIGQTVNLRTRISGHFTNLKNGTHCNRHLQYAFNSSGKDSFYPYVAEFCSIEKLTEREQFWIDFFGIDRIYNLAPAAGSCLGVKHTDETRAKVSAANKGRKQAKHVRDAVSKSNAIRQISDETRAKLARATGARICTDEIRAKLSAANKGRRLTDIHKKKLSLAKSKRISALGESLTYSEWSQRTEIPESTIISRISRGWDIVRALSTPRRKQKDRENPRKKIHDFGSGLGVLFSASPNERRTA